MDEPPKVNRVFAAPPMLPVEFPLVVTVQAGKFGLYECSLCHALVTEPGAQPHADWHTGEYTRFRGL